MSGNIVLSFDLPIGTDIPKCFVKNGNYVYIGTNANKVYKIAYDIGNLITTYIATANINCIDIDNKGSIAIGLYQAINNVIKLDGNLNVLNTATHTNINSTNLGYGPGAIKMDSSNGFIYTGYYADNVYRHTFANKILS